MVSNLVFYQLALIALVWLFLMLSWWWPSEPAAARPIPPTPVTPPRKRSTAPKPFTGLARKPHCDACEHATQVPTVAPPPAPPPQLVPTRGHRRHVDTSRHCCPDADCRYGGWLGLGNISANGHPSGGPWRQLYCSSCQGYFLETHGTIFHGKRVSVDLIVHVIGCLAEGLGLRGTARDPQSKLLLAIDVGARTLAMAQGVVHQVAQLLAPDCVPLFLTDGFKEYMTALLTHYGRWVQPLRRHTPGPAPKPRWMPRPGLLYAQVIKTVRRRRLVRVSHRVVFGTLAAVEQVLAACGWQINTAFIERLNLSMRQHVAAIGRRVTTLCKHEDGLRQQLTLYHVYYNFCLPHASLRVPLPQLLPTNGTGSAKQWRPCTPAMAAGLTDHVWSLREVLLFRVPPWPQPAGV